MKILIIASPRSGSSTLFKGLKNGISNCVGYFEPTNLDAKNWFDNSKGIDLTYPNVILKGLSHQTSLEARNTLPNLINTVYHEGNFDVSWYQDLAIRYWLDLSKNFDKVILLTRLNEVESAKSYAHAAMTVKYHESYQYDINQHDYKPWLRAIRNFNDIIYVLSDELNIPITYYENLYTGNKIDLNNFLEKNQIKLDNPQALYDACNLNNRYRKNS